jgi:hypothetical protein
MMILIKILLAYIFADFLAGLYHWIKDTYFGPFTPIIGKTFIWGSRLHHIRPRYVLDFSDIELFISSSKWTLIWMLPLFLIYGLNSFLLTLFLTISMNDIVHKYSHMKDSERPKWATYLQNLHIFQSHDEHHLHHISPHDINYCPITPYVNVCLEKISFWRNLEYIVERLTGISPRSIEYDFIEDPSYPACIKFLP